MSEKELFARFNEPMRMVILEKIDFEHPVSALSSELFEISVRGDCDAMNSTINTGVDKTSTN